MSDLKTRPVSYDEVDGLDEASAGVPTPHNASEFAGDFALPTVIPRRAHPLAVIAFIMAFVMPVVAIPLAHHVLRKLQHEGGRGATVARAAIATGYLSLLLIALVGVNVAVAVLF